MISLYVRRFGNDFCECRKSFENRFDRGSNVGRLQPDEAVKLHIRFWRVEDEEIGERQ